MAINVQDVGVAVTGTIFVAWHHSHHADTISNSSFSRVWYWTNCFYIHSVHMSIKGGLFGPKRLQGWQKIFSPDSQPSLPTCGLEMPLRTPLERNTAYMCMITSGVGFVLAMHSNGDLLTCWVSCISYSTKAGVALSLVTLSYWDGVRYEVCPMSYYVQRLELTRSIRIRIRIWIVFQIWLRLGLGPIAGEIHVIFWIIVKESDLSDSHSESVVCIQEWDTLLRTPQHDAVDA